MKSLTVFFIFLIFVIAGCIEARSDDKNIIETPLVTQVPTPDPASEPEITATPTPVATPVVTETPVTEFHRFLVWLKEDGTDSHPYVSDLSTVYEDQYVCSQFTKDFIKNATMAGFEVYSAGLTGAVSGQSNWHMLAAVVLDDTFYFVDPQNDKMFEKKVMFQVYGYEYAYFGKDVVINRNEAKVSDPIRYHSVIGLNGKDFIYLR